MIGSLSPLYANVVEKINSNGSPTRPDYPYAPMSQNVRHKIGIYSSIVLAAVAMLYGLSVMFGE